MSMLTAGFLVLFGWSSAHAVTIIVPNSSTSLGRPLPTGAAAVKLMGDSAGIVRSVLAMDLRMDGANFTAPGAAAESIPTSLTLTPEDHARIAAFLAGAEKIAPKEPLGGIVVPGNGLSTGLGISLTSLQGRAVSVRPGAQSSDLTAQGSYNLLATVVTALREAAPQGSLSRDKAIEAAQLIFDGAVAQAAQAPAPPRQEPAPAPAPLEKPEAPALVEKTETPAPVKSEAASPSGLIVLAPAVPENLLRAPQNAALSGPEGDRILDSAQKHALGEILSKDARDGQMNPTPLAERMLTVIRGVQGFERPIPLVQWLSESSTKNSRTSRSSLDGFVSAVNDAVAALFGRTKFKKWLMPSVALDDISVLENWDDVELQSRVEYQLELTQSGDLRRAGAFLYDGRIYFTGSFLKRAHANEIAAALFAMHLIRAGWPAKAVASLTRRITERAFAKADGAVTVDRLADIASLSAVQDRKAHTRSAERVPENLGRGASDAPLPLSMRLRASLGAAFRRLAAFAGAALRVTGPFLPAALLAAYALLYPARALPGMQSLFLVLALFLGGWIVHRLEPRRGRSAENPSVSSPVGEDDRAFTLETTEAQFLREAVDPDGVAMRQELIFVTPESEGSPAGEVVVGFEDTEENFVDVIFMVPEDGRQSQRTIVSDREYHLERDRTHLISVSAYKSNVWPGLRAAARDYALGTKGSPQIKKRVLAFLVDFERRLSALSADQ